MGGEKICPGKRGNVKPSSLQKKEKGVFGHVKAEVKDKSMFREKRVQGERIMLRVCVFRKDKRSFFKGGGVSL